MNPVNAFENLVLAMLDCGNTITAGQLAGLEEMGSARSIECTVESVLEINGLVLTEMIDGRFTAK